MPRALVTGASGFVGRHLLAALTARGWEVHAVLRRAAELPQGVTAHVHDGSTEGMCALVSAARPDVVFHLAAAVIGQHASADLLPLIQSNIAFGTQLLEAMAKQGARRLVNTGSYWQHYEGQAYGPVNLYAASKQAFEAMLEFYVQAEGLDAITLKLFDTYGPGDTRPKLLKLLRNAQESGETLKLSPGEQRVDLVHVDDVCAAYCQAAALLLASDRKRSAGHARYAVTSGLALPLHGIVAVYESATGKPVPVHWGGRPYRAREMMLPHCPDAPLPGWIARIGLEEGLRGLLKTPPG